MHGSLRWTVREGVGGVGQLGAFERWRLVCPMPVETWTDAQFRSPRPRFHLSGSLEPSGAAFAEVAGGARACRFAQESVTPRISAGCDGTCWRDGRRGHFEPRRLETRHAVMTAPRVLGPDLA